EHSSIPLSNATITSFPTKIEGSTNYTIQQQTTTRHQLQNLTKQQSIPHYQLPKLNDP
ncbi:26413_t:CDS:1, partial [Gigaspora margarita]